MKQTKKQTLAKQPANTNQIKFKKQRQKKPHFSTVSQVWKHNP